MSWNNKDFGDNEIGIFSYDQQYEKLIDMRATNTYALVITTTAILLSMLATPITLLTIFNLNMYALVRLTPIRSERKQHSIYRGP
jgi:hypothetical protein